MYRPSSDRQWVREEAIEASIGVLLAHRPPDGHHQRNGGIDHLVRPLIGRIPVAASVCRSGLRCRYTIRAPLAVRVAARRLASRHDLGDRQDETRPCVELRRQFDTNLSNREYDHFIGTA
jgi:hypothetical protein